MSKNILQDVMPPRRRSIRDIPLSGNKKKENLPHVDMPVNEIPANEMPAKEDTLSKFSGPIEGIRSSKKEGGGKMKWWILIITIIVVCGFLFSVVFAGAKVIISPKQEKIDFTSNITAVKSSAVSNESGIPFSILTIEEESSLSSSNFSEKEVAKKAAGEIVIFNEFDSAPQRLVIQTRFETADGKIYRLPKSVTVPGRTIDANGKVTPGSIQVTVQADLPGEEYNIGLVDFTVPGFKGSDRYSKFYARSKTPIAGGYSGVMKMIEEKELEKLKEDIHTDLNTKLTNSIYSQVPEGFVLYADGIYIDYKSQENIDLGDSIKVLEKGILTAVIFEKEVLSNYIAKEIITDLGAGRVEILNIEDLLFTIDGKEYVDISSQDSFDFSLEGKADFVWIFDQEKMKDDLVGQPKKNVNGILLNYSGIEQVEVILSPFWKRSFPENVNRIEIIRDLEAINP